MKKTKELLPSSSGKLFVVSAPSGAGKTTIVNAAIEQLHKGNISIDRVVTYTTRNPRGAEERKSDYHYISPDEFERKIGENFFLEWSNDYGNYYGSPKSIIGQLKTTSFILIIDRLGWRNILKQNIGAVSIWIEPPSLMVLQERLTLRSRDDEDDVTHRLKLAAYEMAQETQKPMYQYKIINDEFDHAVTAFETIVLQELF